MRRMGGRICAGDRSYGLELREQGGRWTAEARQIDGGTPAGSSRDANTAEQAIDQLTRWLTWQQTHWAALEQLQDAERFYHRIVTGNAFGSAEMSDAQREALQHLEEACRTLDVIRAAQPS